MENQVQIPHELIFNILLKLPVKSVGRLSCVSKQWLSTIRSKLFIKNYISSSSNHPCFLVNYIRSVPAGFELYFDSLSQNDSSSVYHGIKVSIQERYINCISPPIQGLICIGYRIGYRNKIVIFNPTTSQLIPLPTVETSRVGIKSFFGYDPIQDEYKVLCMTISHRRRPIISEEHQVFTVGAKRRWRKIECKFQHSLPCLETGVSKNGVIYYGAWTNLKREKYIIMGFDVRLEEFSVVELPNGVVFGTGRRIDLFNYEGKLGLMNSLHEGAATMWVLKDVKKEEWCKIHEFPVLPMNLICKGSISDEELVFAPKAYSTAYYCVVFYHIPTHIRTATIEIQPQDNDKITLHLGYVENPMML